MLYYFFWVIPGCLNFVPTFWNTLFHLHCSCEQEEYLGRDCYGIYTVKHLRTCVNTLVISSQIFLLFTRLRWKSVQKRRHKIVRVSKPLTLRKEHGLRVLQECGAEEHVSVLDDEITGNGRA
jgi:hypothetical protein